MKQYVQLVGRGLVSFRAEDGKFLWNYNRVANQIANIPTPLVEGNYVFTSTGYQAGAALLELHKQGDGVAAEEVYFLPGNKVQNHHGGMVLLGDYIYMGNGHNNGFPLCLELKTGKVMWNGGRGAGTGSAAVLEADGELYFRYQNGVMALVEANPEKYVLKGKFDLATHNGESWPHPVIVDHCLYVRDQDALLCYDIGKRVGTKQRIASRRSAFVAHDLAGSVAVFLGFALPLEENVDFASQLAERDRLHHHPRGAGLLELRTQCRLAFRQHGDIHEPFAVEFADLVVDVDDFLADRVADQDHAIGRIGADA